MALRFLIVITLLLAVAAPAAAQDGGNSTECQALYLDTIQTVTGNCAGLQNNTVCLGSGEVVVEMASGQTVTNTGGGALLTGVATIQVGPGDGTAWNIAAAYLPDLVNSDEFAALILIGPATLEMESADNLPPGAAFHLTTGKEPVPCGDLAQPGLLVQSPPRGLTLLRVNGVDLAVNGAAVIHAPDGEGLAVSALARETILSQSATVVFAGYSTVVTPDGAASQVVPYDPASVAHLPVELLPRLLAVPVPGNAMVLEAVSLHLRPDRSAYTGKMVKAGLPVTVLGRSTDGAWLHVVSYDGETGWVPREVLDENLPVDPPVYDKAPEKPARTFGPVQAVGVTTAELSNFRDGPGQGYQVVATAPLGTEVGIYARSPDTGWLLAQLPDGLRAWISVQLVQVTSAGVTLEELPLSPDFPG
jgi:hypothetical protein